MKVYPKHINEVICFGLTLREFRCKCNFKGCTMTIVSEKLIEAYERLRKRVGIPLTINSGYRCPQHNSNQKGSSRVSRHCFGYAVDIAYNFEMDPNEFLRIANECGFKFVKFYRKKHFFHLDVREY